MITFNVIAALNQQIKQCDRYVFLKKPSNNNLIQFILKAPLAANMILSGRVRSHYGKSLQFIVIMKLVQEDAVLIESLVPNVDEKTRNICAGQDNLAQYIMVI